MTVGFDIGGTNARAAVVDADGVIVDSLGTHTPHDTEGLTRTIVQMVDELRASHDIGAVGVAVAGFLDPDCEICLLYTSDAADE